MTIVQSLTTLTHRLCLLLPVIQTSCGETVQLSPSVEYIACNVELTSQTSIPDKASTLLQHVKRQLGDRGYNLPAYLFAGRSQIGVVEVLRGGSRSLMAGTVQLICKYVDLLDVAMDERTNRCIVLTVGNEK